MKGFCTGAGVVLVANGLGLNGLDYAMFVVGLAILVGISRCKL
jgi:hypothetical protein